MRKRELEKLLFQAVADALGVEVTTSAKAAKNASPKAAKPAVATEDHRAAA